MADDRLHEAMMRKALAQARKGEGYTSPNPIVGAVVYNRNGIIATGYHRYLGGPHAEREALRKAGSRARGATIAVSLEPCCHQGRTGPCTDALIDAGIKTVVYAVKDPNPKVCGRGAAQLAGRGIEVISGVGAAEALRVNEVYFHFIATGRPFVVLKLAQSLDGRIGTRTGDSKWITGEPARAFGHRLRARYDAVAVGSGTVRADNPQLTVRHVKGNNPLRILITTSADLPPKLNLLANNGDGKTIVATTRKAIASNVYKSALTWPVRKKGNGLDLEDLLDRAAGHEITSILFEGGSRLATTLLKRRLVDKLYLITAPKIIGDGTSGIGDLGITSVAGAITFSEYGHRKIGSDMIFWGYPEK